MPAKKTSQKLIRVAVSFNGFDLGEKFVGDPEDGWTKPLVEAGYLEVLDDAPAEMGDGSAG